MTTIIMGIDPGVTGGLAFLSAEAIEAFDIPVVAGEVDVDELLRMIRRFAPMLAAIERAGAMPGQGVSSTFKFGMAYGSLRASLVACGIPTHLVAATKWKRSFGLDGDKEKSRALAIRLWPGCGLFARKRDHNRAEASLIAKYGLDVLARPPNQVSNSMETNITDSEPVGASYPSKHEETKHG